jgi:single stranded DNA-binding protein
VNGATAFLRCTAWRRTAENVVECLRKGNRVGVSGRLQQRVYETEDGQRRSTIELVADEVSVSLRHAIVRGVPSRAHTDAGQAVQPAPLERREATPVTESGGTA